MTKARNRRSSFFCKNACRSVDATLQKYSATFAEMLQKGLLATCKWLPARFRKTFFNIEITSAVFQLVAILFDFSCLRHNAINTVIPICFALQNVIVKTY